MKVTLKRGELVELNMMLREMSSKASNCDKRFKFAVVRNLEYFEPEMKAIQETQKPNPKFEEYQNKRMQIGEEFADKDEKGQPKKVMIEGNQVYEITEKKDEANAKVVELVKEYSDVIEEQKSAIEEFNTLMEEEVETDICKISFEYLPEDANYAALKYIIKETPEEIEEKYL